MYVAAIQTDRSKNLFICEGNYGAVAVNGLIIILFSAILFYPLIQLILIQFNDFNTMHIIINNKHFMYLLLLQYL